MRHIRYKLKSKKNSTSHTLKIEALNLMANKDLKQKLEEAKNRLKKFKKSSTISQQEEPENLVSGILDELGLRRREKNNDE